MPEPKEPLLSAHHTGSTPLEEVRLAADDPAIVCKLEYLNPSGSTKDRIASHILTKARQEGVIGEGSLVCEASSGSTSIAMAMVCARMGMRFVAVLPEGVSNERVKMIRGYGGEVCFCRRELGIGGCIELTREFQRREGAFLPRQFENMDNAEAHRLGTAREVASQVSQRPIDAVVSGVGTGGTLVGLHQGMVDVGWLPTPVLARPVCVDGGASYEAGCFAQGECCSFSTCVPGVMDNQSKILQLVDLPGLITVEIDERRALETTRKLIRKGFPVGPSSGLNYAAAVEAARLLPDAGRILTVFPDRMERYFSTGLFANDGSAPTPAEHPC